MPEVSVIIPNFNHFHFLQQRLDSVLKQDFQDFEVIILDDCSTDNSKLIIEQYRNHPKVSAIIYNESNSGKPFLQWVKGIRAATGKYFWIAESDDYCDFNFLSTGLSALQSSEAQIFYCKTLHVNDTGTAFRSLYWWYDDLDPAHWQSGYVETCDKEIRQKLKYKNYIANTSAVIFQNTPDVLQFLKEVVDWKYCGDWMFWLKLFNTSEKVAYSVDTTNYWREHSATTRADKHDARNMEMLKIYGWISKNISGEGNLDLLRYYYRNHLYPIARKNLKAHFNMVSESIKHAPLLTLLELQYYIYPKSLHN